MKKSSSAFLAGVCTACLVGGLSLSVLAASGCMTIDVTPISIQVNGTEFAPTDVNGNPVPVFAYEGTTYAPLRALAEAYGLEVGYDAERNMATVTDPDAAVEEPEVVPEPVVSTDYSTWTAEEEAAYEEFKSLWKEWDVRPTEILSFNLTTDFKSAKETLKKYPAELIEKCSLRMDAEVSPGREIQVTEIRYHFAQIVGGWVDKLTDSGWVCGYQKCYPNPWQ